MTNRFKNLFDTVINSTWLLPAVVAAGVALRISGLTTSAIWYDEALPLQTAKLPFLTMLDATKYTFSPPLWAVVVWFSTRLFGANEFGLRLPALLFSILALRLAHQIAKEFHLSRNQVLISMIVIALMPYQFAMAQDGRMYTLLVVLLLTTAWFALKDHWPGLTISATLLLYTHYTAPFYLVAIFLMALFNGSLDLRRFRNVILSGLTASLLFLPWLPNYLETLKIDSPVNRLTIAELTLMLYRITFEDTLSHLPALLILSMVTIDLLLLVTAGTSIRVLLSRPKQGGTASDSAGPETSPKRYLQLTIFAALPLLIMVTWSMVWKNFLYYRLISAMLVPLTLWVVHTLGRFRMTKVIADVLFASTIFLLCVGMITWSPHAKGGNLRETAKFINEQWQDGDIIYHITGTSYLPAMQYFQGKPQYLIEETQHEWLLDPNLQVVFEIPREPLEQIGFNRAWVFYTRSILSPEGVQERADRYIDNGVFITTVEGWRYETAEVYLVHAEDFLK